MEIPEDDKLREWNQLVLLERIQNDFMINTSEKLRYIEHLHNQWKIQRDEDLQYDWYPDICLSFGAEINVQTIGSSAMPVMYGKYKITIPNNMRGIYKMEELGYRSRDKLHEDSERRWWNEMLRVTDVIYNMEERHPTTYFWTKRYKEYKFVISLGTSCSYHFRI